MEHPAERYYRLNRFFLSVNGLWPYQNAWNTCLATAVVTFTVLLAMYCQLSIAFSSDITLEYVIDLISRTLPTCGTLCHMCLRVIHKGKFRELFDRMRHDWSLPKADDEMKIMREHAETTRSFTLYLTIQAWVIIFLYSIWMFSSEILDVILPMNESRPRKETFKFETLIDEERYYLVIRFEIFIIMLILSGVMIASCSLFLVFTEHVCAICELLGYRAERLFCDVESVVGCDLIRGTKAGRRDTAVLVQLHYDVTQFIGTVENAHAFLFLFDIVGIVITMSLTLTQMFTTFGNFEQAFRSTSLSILQLLYLFLYNYQGQRIMDANWNMCGRVYNSAWYNATVSEQKPLLLIMRRSLQPFALTAGKIYTLSLRNFEMILHTAISYCMFIRRF